MDQPNIEKMKANKDVEGLIEALKHGNVDVRRAAIEALGKIGDARAVEPLILALLNDTSGNVRAVAAKALGEIGDERAVGPLTRVLYSYEHGGISEEDVKKALEKIKARKS